MNTVKPIKLLFNKIFLLFMEMWFLLISTYHETRFYKMRVSWEFNIYNLFKSFY